MKNKTHINRREKRNAKIQQSRSYGFIRVVKRWMDDYHLDGILGLVMIPGLRDINKVFSLPYIYVSLFKLGSIPLTLAVMFNMLLDVLIGSFPFIGPIFDFFFRSYAKNYKLIVGFVEDDREVIKQVNKNALWMGLGIVLISCLIYLVVSFVIYLIRSLNLDGWFS